MTDLISPVYAMYSTNKIRKRTWKKYVLNQEATTNYCLINSKMIYDAYENLSNETNWKMNFSEPFKDIKKYKSC